MASTTPEIAQRFLQATVTAVKEFVVECMTLAGKVAGPTSPGSPTHSHLSAPALVSRESDGTVGGPYAVSTQEQAWYYYGIWDHLRRRPTRISLPHQLQGRPLGAADRQIRQHAHQGIVGPQVDDLVHAAVGRSYSIDLARFFTVPNGEDVEKGTLGPAIVWVTVDATLNTSVDTAHVSESILALLATHGVHDAHVEWCEGVTVKLAGLPLLPAVSRYNPTAHARRHLTTLLGMPITPAEMEDLDRQGSVGFYFHENIDEHGDPSHKVLGVTNHHVLCKDDNKTYDFRATGSPHQHVRVCGSRRFQRGVNEIRDAVANHGHEVSVCTEAIADLEVSGDEGDPAALANAQQELEGHRAAIIVDLEILYNEVNASWADSARRNIGVLEYSPPISVEADDRRYTRDFATI